MSAHRASLDSPDPLRCRAILRCYGDGMREEPTLSIHVDCYAGHRGEQTPRALIVGGRRVDVSAVLDSWLAPDHRYFKLQGTDGDTYLVRHDEHAQTWELTMFRRSDEDR